MAAKTVLNYLPRESVIHRMTGTTKLAFFLLFTFASMITYNTWVLLGLLAVSLLAFKLSHIKFREVRFMMTFMLVFLLLNNLFIFLFDPNQGTTLYGTRTVLCHLFWRYDLTAEQLFYMLNISLKYFVALPVAILFISATDPSEFALVSRIKLAIPWPLPCGTSRTSSGTTTASARPSRPAAWSWARRSPSSNGSRIR